MSKYVFTQVSPVSMYRSASMSASIAIERNLEFQGHRVRRRGKVGGCITTRSCSGADPPRSPPGCSPRPASAPDASGRPGHGTADPAARQADRRVIDLAAREFVRIDERSFGRPYHRCSMVSVPASGDTRHTGAIRPYEHDSATAERRVHELGVDRVPWNLVFVPAGSETGEDAGWHLGLVFEPRMRRRISTITTRASEAPPVATIHLEHRIPPRLDGNRFQNRKAR